LLRVVIRFSLKFYLFFLILKGKTKQNISFNPDIQQSASSK
jgi:hypothetical protein